MIDPWLPLFIWLAGTLTIWALIPGLAAYRARVSGRSVGSVLADNAAGVRELAAYALVWPLMVGVVLVRGVR